MIHMQEWAPPGVRPKGGRTRGAGPYGGVI